VPGFVAVMVPNVFPIVMVVTLRFNGLPDVKLVVPVVVPKFHVRV
jgi:hypothetical protein